jgi:DNA-binding NtrC family response regulator
MGSVLIVDDEPKIRELLARWLSESKYRISEAPDAETALDVMAAEPADAVLCDIEMPGKGGLWLVPQLRAKFPTTAVILATGLDTVPPVVSLQHGVVQYLVKPFKRDRVLTTVADALQWHKKAAQRAPEAHAGDPVSDWLNQSHSKE